MTGHVTCHVTCLVTCHVTRDNKCRRTNAVVSWSNAEGIDFDAIDSPLPHRTGIVQQASEICMLIDHDVIACMLQSCDLLA